MKRLLTVLALVAGSLAILAPSAQARASGGYWMLAGDGRVYPFGGASTLGNGTVINYQKNDIAPTPSRDGYWLLNETGAVENFGDAEFYGPYVLSLQADEKTTGISSTPSGKGYWLFTNKGRVFAYGDAKHFGDMSGTALNGAVLDAVPTPSGRGYYMVAADGGIFTFGDATFRGSMGAAKLNKPVMSMAPDADGDGYWLVASDGGIFAFNAPFFGSTGNLTLNKPIVGIVASPTGRGYLMVASDGGVFSFGDVPFHGSLGSNPPSSPVVSIAAIGDPPVMEFQRVFEQSGVGALSTSTFQLTADVARLNWSCAQPSSYSAGCHFVVNDFLTGDQISSGYVSTNPGQNGVLLLHPDHAGTYYIETDTYTSAHGDAWTVSIDQQRCVENCG